MKSSFKTLILCLFACGLVVGFEKTASAAPGKGDDVFVDEGDGDFGTIPKVPASGASAKSIPQPEVAPAQPVRVKRDEMPPPTETTTVRESAPKAKRAPASVGGAGIYVVTKAACPMTREPDAGSEAMLTVKASKRLWVQEVDGSWVRAFNKAGEAGYLSRDCLK